MSSLNAFFNPIEVENREVIVSQRFQEDGRPIPFIIKPISQEENKKLMKKFTIKDKKGVQSFDRTEYIANLAAQAVVFPDLTNAELQKKYGVLGESNLLQKMLYVGEYAVLIEAIQELSGFDEDINDDIEEVKNE